jgi:hypothetical protein
MTFGDVNLTSSTPAPVSTTPATVPLTQAPVVATTPVTPLPANVTPYTPAQVQAFQTQLAAYQNQLLSVYDARGQMIADREQAKFQFLDIWRFQFEFTLNQMANQAANPGTFTSYLNQYILAYVPVTNMDGSVANQYYGLAPAWEGITDFNGLSPMNTILESANFDADVPSMTSIYFLWPDGSGVGQPYGEVATQPGTQISFPTSAFTSSLASGVTGNASDASLFTTDYGQGTFNALMNQGLALILNLCQQTQGIVDNETTVIEPLEQEVANFITQYQSYGMIDQTVTTSSILTQVNQLMAVQNAQTALQVATNPPSQNSALQNIPSWAIYGAGAVILILLMRKK